MFLFSIIGIELLSNLTLIDTIIFYKTYAKAENHIRDPLSVDSIMIKAYELNNSNSEIYRKTKQKV